MTTETITEEVKAHKWYALAQRIKMGEAGGNYLYCTEEDKFYIYSDGYWKSMMPIDFLGTIEERFPIIIKQPLSIRRQIIDNFKTIGRKPLAMFNQLPLINLENYMFDPSGVNILGHKKEQYSTIRIPYLYDEKAKCELWIKSLAEILENDKNKLELLQEFFGYCLTADVTQKKALLLIGDSNTGKSTVLFILRNLIGDKNCSSVPLKFISNPQYTPMLVNKLVNIDADVDKNASNYEAEFKIITSGEPIACNQKFVATFEFVPQCKIVLAANVFPKITDHSSAFYKRLILIPLDKVFEESEQNKQLKFQLLEELPGILNWAVTGLQRLKKRGMFAQHDFMKDAVKELEDDNNPVNLFFEENIVADTRSDVFITKSDLYAKYLQWVINTNNYKLSQPKFAQCVYKKYHKFTTKDCRLPHNGARIWRNIKYINPIYSNTIDEKNINWQESSS